MDKEHFQHFLDFHPREARYELAGKTLKYRVYRAIENYVLVSFVLSLLVIWIPASPLKTLLAWNTLPVVLAGLAHHAKLIGQMPWLVIAAAFEAGCLWAVYHWGVSRVLILPDFWIVCVFVFVVRYWVRGERQVDAAAFRKATKPRHDRNALQDYEECFGPLPEGLLKMAANLGTAGRLEADLAEAVRRGSPIENFAPYRAGPD